MAEKSPLAIDSVLEGERRESLARMGSDPSNCGLYATLRREVYQLPNMRGDYGLATIRLLTAIHSSVCPKGRTAHAMDATWNAM